MDSEAMKTPKVSVLMPTYNYARFLGEAIESVLAQDFQDYEFIIIDDCSQDESREVAGQYAGRHPQLHFVSNPANLGMVANWNHCLAAARGQYVKILFGDDKLAGPTALGEMVSMLEADEAIVMAASGRVVIDEGSREVDRWAPFGGTGRYAGRKAIWKCIARHANLIGEPSAVMFRRSAVARGFDEGFQQLVDLEMWFHLLEQGDLAYTRQMLACFRVHAGQQSKLNAAQKRGEKEYGRLLKQYDKPGILAESSVWERRDVARHLAWNAHYTGQLQTAMLAVHYHQSLPLCWRLFFWITHEAAELRHRLRLSIMKRFWRLFHLVVQKKERSDLSRKGDQERHPM